MSKEKIFTKPSEQYGKGNVPQLKDETKATIKQGNVPYCKIHGALLCYKGNIYRCIECGWAVYYER